MKSRRPKKATEFEESGYLEFLGRPKRLNRRQFVCKVRIILPDGTKKIATVLIDTGSEVNLISKEFAGSCLKQAVKPVHLEGAGGHHVDGGKEGCEVQLRFITQQVQNWSALEEINFTVYCYAAPIKYHMYLGNPFLWDHRLSPMAHRGCFLQDLEEVPNAYVWPGVLSLEAFKRHQDKIQAAVKGVLEHSGNSTGHSSGADGSPELSGEQSGISSTGHGELPCYLDIPCDPHEPESYRSVQHGAAGDLLAPWAAVANYRETPSLPPKSDLTVLHYWAPVLQHGERDQEVLENSLDHSGQHGADPAQGSDHLRPSGSSPRLFKLLEKWKRRVQRYFRFIPDIEAKPLTCTRQEQSDGKPIKWHKANVWINNPFSDKEVAGMINRVKEERVKAIMIVPDTPTKSWFGDLLDISTDIVRLPPMELTGWKDNQPRRSTQPLLAALVDGKWAIKYKVEQLDDELFGSDDEYDSEGMTAEEYAAESATEYDQVSPLYPGVTHVGPTICEVCAPQDPRQEFQVHSEGGTCCPEGSKSALGPTDPRS